MILSETKNLLLFIDISPDNSDNKCKNRMLNYSALRLFVRH